MLIYFITIISTFNIKILKKLLTFSFLLDIINSSKQTKQIYRTGGRDHRKQNELPYNLRKEGIVHQRIKLIFPLNKHRGTRKVLIKFFERSFTDVDYGHRILKRIF